MVAHLSTAVSMAIKYCCSLRYLPPCALGNPKEKKHFYFGYIMSHTHSSMQHSFLSYHALSHIFTCEINICNKKHRVPTSKFMQQLHKIRFVTKVSVDLCLCCQKCFSRLNLKDSDHSIPYCNPSFRFRQSR